MLMLMMMMMMSVLNLSKHRAYRYCCTLWNQPLHAVLMWPLGTFLVRLLLKVVRIIRRCRGLNHAAELRYSPTIKVNYNIFIVRQHTHARY